MNIGEYNIIAQLTEDSIYQWVEAVANNKQNRVILQLVKPHIPQRIISEEIISYFDKLQMFRRKGIWHPEQIFNSDQYPLVIVYSYKKIIPLNQILQQIPLNEALEWWHQASETIHALHNQDMIHGYININCFVVTDRHLHLTGFGYTPFLKPEYKKFLNPERNTFAPEVLAQEQITKAADIYAFAKTIAGIYPDLKDTSWYSKATNPNIDKRFQRMRNLFHELKQIVAELFQSSPEKEDIPESKPKIPENEIVPKYTLLVKVEPPEAGKVIGGGNYTVDKNATVTASNSVGWNFHHWTGDVSGFDNLVTVKMDANKTLVAHFTAEVQNEVQPKPKVSLHLWVSAEPTEAGFVEGGGEYEIGSLVRVRALANSKLWSFDSWSGDVKGSENPAELLMDANKKIQAKFTKVSLKPKKTFFGQPPVFENESNTKEQTQHSTDEKKQNPTNTSRIPKWAQPKTFE